MPIAAVDEITGIDNREGIFPIHRALRFVLLTCTPVAAPRDDSDESSVLTGELTALMQSDYLGQVRTGAASAVATSAKPVMANTCALRGQKKLPSSVVVIAVSARSGSTSAIALRTPSDAHWPFAA